MAARFNKNDKAFCLKWADIYMKTTMTLDFLLKYK